MAPKFEFDSPDKAQKNAVKGTTKRGRDRFDLSSARMKEADAADKFQFADAGKTPGADEQSTVQLVDKGRRFGKQKQDEQGPMYGYRKHRFHKADEVSVFDAQEDARRTDPRNQTLLILTVIAVVATVICTILPNGIFGDDITRTFADVVTLVKIRVSELANYVSGSGRSFEDQPDIWRFIIIALSGAALGMTGAVYQGSLKNALASPTTLGVTAGGTLGAMIYVVISSSAIIGTGSIILSAADAAEVVSKMSVLEYFVFRNGQALASIVGCFAVVAIVLGVSHIAGKGKMSGVALIVCGQVMMMTINAGSSLIRQYYANQDPYGPISQSLRAIRSYSFSSYYLPIDALLVGVPILVCVVIVMRLRLRMSLLTFSDEEARSMGLSVNAMRNLMIGVCTVMTAIVISFGGNTGFVGFLVPHITRRIIGPDFKFLIPASALVGSSFLVITYYLTSLFEGLSGGVGLFTSIIGGVLFICLALNSRGRSSADGF